MKKNKTLKVLTATTLLAGIAAPVAFVAPAYAASYTATAPVSIQSGTDANLGKVFVQFDATRIATGDSLTLKLPTDFELVDNDTTWNTNKAQFDVTSGKNALTSTSFGTAFKIDVISKNEVKLTALADGNNATAFPGITGTDKERNGYFSLNLKNAKVASGFNGPVTVDLTGKGEFNSGSVTVANVGTGSVTASIDDVKTITSGGGAISQIRFKEDRPGGFSSGDTIKFKLPAGFQWAGTPSVKVLEGKTGASTNLVDSDVVIDSWQSDEGRTFKVKFKKETTNEAAYVLVNGLQIGNIDESVAKFGDVNVSVGGDVSNKVSNLLVAKYGDYGVKAYAEGEPTNVQAGLTGEKLGKFAIEETAPNAFVEKRTLTFTLIGNAKWASNDSDLSDLAFDNELSKNTDDNILNANVTQANVIGTDKKTLKLTVGAGASADQSKAIKAVLKDAKIDVSAEATGDIKVAVGGSVGATGELTLAHVVKPVTATIDGQTPSIITGVQGQAIGDIVLKENKSGAIDKDGSFDTITLIFPEGVNPTIPSKVEVTDGDVSLDTSTISKEWKDSKYRINIQTKATSTKASTIKISGIKVTADRAVPEGDVIVGVSGDALNQSLVQFPGAEVVTNVSVAKVTTPAPGKGSATKLVFKLGATSYTVDGVEKTADVAPFAQNNRTYLPVRFAAEALGAKSVNWDQATKTVTIIKDNNIVQMKLGEKAYYLNGVRIPMDVAVMATPEKRIVLPIRFLGDALGVQTNYNETTNEITLG